MMSFATPLACPPRSLPIAALSLILAACAGPAPKESPTSAKIIPQVPQVPASQPHSSPSVALPSDGHPMPTLPGQARSEDEEAAATALETVEVNESKLVGYNFLVSQMGAGNPDTIWLHRPSPFYPPVIFWTEAGYDGYQLVAIEGKGLADLSTKQVFSLVKTLPEPMHFTIRSRSGGRIVQLEAFYSPDGRIRRKDAPPHPMVQPRK